MQQQTYSNQFKENLLKKSFAPNAPSISSIAKTANMPEGTLYAWISKARKGEIEVKVNKKKNKIDSAFKLEAITKLSVLSEQELGNFLRKNGLHKQQVENWKIEVEELLRAQNISSGKHKKDPKDARIKELEKELHRKEKALAEASALLILKKKANLIWGDEED